MKKSNDYKGAVQTAEYVEVFPKLDYSVCGFSPVHGDKIAVFDVYLDESGTHSNQFLVVAGYVGEVNKWVDFSVTWKAVLREYNISHFHMKDFRSSHARAFKHLSRRQKEELLTALVKCIQDTAILGVTAAVRPFVYHRLSTPEFRSFYGSSYALCTIACVIMALHRLPELRTSVERVGVFLEEGHKNIGQALEEIRGFKKRTEPVDPEVKTFIGNAIGEPYEELPTVDEVFRSVGYKIGAIGQGSKLDMLPLQAADLLAYCFYSTLAVQRERFCTGVIDTIRERVPHYECSLGGTAIRRMIADIAEAEGAERAYRKDTHSLARHLRSFGIEAQSVPEGVSVEGNLTEVLRRMAEWRDTKK